MPGLIPQNSFMIMMKSFFESGGLALLKTMISEKTLKEISRDIRLGPPIARPSKLICIGLNYSDHAIESKMQLPPEPVIFFTDL